MSSETRPQTRSRWTIIAAVAVGCVIGAATFLFGEVISRQSQQSTINARLTRLADQNASNTVTQAHLHLQLVEGCERLNIQRATANSSYAADFRIDTIFYRAIRAEPSKKHESRKQRLLIRRFLDAERNALNMKEWTPLTNCAQAVAISGGAYLPPSPISFSRLLPPASALDFVNARKPIPAGSIP